MAKYRMNISQTEQKILFAKSGNVCAFPDCDSPIIADVGDDSKPLAEMAHIIASSDDGPRSDPSLPTAEINKASNLILLCPNHHALVDKFEYQYNTHVLREMKLQHEQQYSGSAPKEEAPLIRESLHASLLPLSRLPVAVFSADTQYNKNNVQELFDALDTNENQNILYAFELRDNKLYTFHDLRSSNNPFWGTYDQFTVKSLKSTDLWNLVDDHRLYIALLNRALRAYLRKSRVAYDTDRHRYYFLPVPTEIKRKFKYKSLAGIQTTKSIVNQPITKATKTPKPYWVHLAANLSFQHIAPRQWVLTIRPERHLTTDGNEPYTHSSIGRKITRIKSTMYNWKYLQEIQLWREFITHATSKLIMRFGKQAIVIENNLLNEAIEWPGIPEDRKDFVFQEHEEDIFTSHEIEIVDKAEEELYDELSLNEYGE